MKSFKMKYFKSLFQTISLILFSDILFCSVLTAQNEPVKIFNTNGSTNEADWKVVEGTPAGLNPSNIILQNGLVRITYPCTRGIPGIFTNSMDNKAGHVIYLKSEDKYILAQDPEFGDWTYVGGNLSDDPTSFKIVRNRKDVAEIVLEFDNHNMGAGDKSLNPCKKHIILYRGQYGYIARIDATTNSPGEREVGFGDSKSNNFVPSEHYFAYSTKTAYLWNPNDSVPGTCCHYEFIRNENQADNNDWWGVGLAFNNSYYRFVGILPQSPKSPAIRSASFRRGNISGLIRYNGMNTTSFSGYEAFVAVIPYDGSDAMNISVDNNKAIVKVPKDGHYTIFSEDKMDEGGSKHYNRLISDLNLKKGENVIDLEGKVLKNPVIAPLSDGISFPVEIFQKYIIMENNTSEAIVK